MTGTKYIGMDVHKESISIAVRSAAGKLVMECVIETKANVILDFIHGLRGELQVTFEEGTWAAWLYDLLKPHVTKLVVCDPRKNSRQGNKNDRIDARELADRLYMNKLSSVYHGGAGVRTLKELARSYLTISKDLGRVMTPSEGDLSQLGYSMCRQASLCAASSCRVAGEDHRVGSASPGRILLPTTRCPESLAPGSQARSVGRESKAQGEQTALPNPFDRSDSGGVVDCADPDTASFSHQAAVLEIQRFCHRNA